MGHKRKVVAKKIAKKARAAHRAKARARSSDAETISSDTDTPETPCNTAPGRGRKAYVLDEEEEEAQHADDEVTEGSPRTSQRSPSVDVQPETAEAERTRLMSEWTAPIYAFFDPVPAIKIQKGRRCHEFKCSWPGCKKPPVRRYLDTADAKSTGALHKHASRCWGPDILKMARRCKTADAARPHIDTAGRSGLITEAFKRVAGSGVTYSSRAPTKLQTRIKFVCWFAESLRPFLTVKDRGFVDLMKTGRPYDYWLPSPSTIAKDVVVVWEVVRRRIVEMLEDYDCEVNFSTDAWTSPNHLAFVAFNLHIERELKPLSVLLNIVEVPESHTGQTLAREFNTVLKDFGIDKKVLGVAGDNASNVDGMVTELEKLADTFRGAHGRVRCFLHILNLVARVILAQFGENVDEEIQDLDRALDDLVNDLEDDDNDEGEATDGIEVVDEDDDEGDEEEEGEGLDDLVADDEINAFLDDREGLREGLKPLRQLQKKLRKLGNVVINSSTKLLPEWKRTCKALSRAVRMMPRYVSTRWNSSFRMLHFAYRYRDVIDKFTECRENGIRELELSKEEWAMVKELRDVLKVFYDATELFSRSQVVNITNVIPVIDRLDEFLSTQATDPTRQAAIRAACSLAKNLLNKYYTKTDESNIYRIAMVLHPRHKLQYFKKAKWQPVRV